MANFDRLKALLAGFIQTVTRQIDYCARYPSTVAGQNADGTLELVPDSPKFAGLSKIKYRVGIPGATLTVAQGTRVLLGFDNADPSKPYAEGWDAVGTVTKLSIVGLEVDIGSTTPADFMLKGTSFYTALSTFDTAQSTYQTAVATFNAALATAFAAIGTATTIAQINAAATPIAAAATAFSTASGLFITAIATFTTAVNAALSGIAKVG